MWWSPVIRPSSSKSSATKREFFDFQKRQTPNA
jgi:hypothetical protein